MDMGGINGLAIRSTSSLDVQQSHPSKAATHPFILPLELREQESLAEFTSSLSLGID